jgi:primosomal protein N' (replication factor Y) (superfamily II helicase)
VILLQNRRGYSPVITCGACGDTPACRDCAVSLTYHASHGHLRCHYCGRVERMPRVCPACNEDALERLGVGTQRVEEEIANVFPDARVLRMDLDTTARRDAHRQLLDAFASGEADILLGTQMVAKGLDFPRVTLVGIVDADTGLTLPDFRAAERTFQLLMQVAGRAGRGDLRGEVFLQTRRPEHPAVVAASRHDFALFASGEMEERRMLGYPPFGRIAGIEFRGPDESAVEEVAERWTDCLSRRGAPVEILGPQPALVGRVKRQYRYHTIVKAERQRGASMLPRLLRAVAAEFGTPPKNVRVNVDVDAAAIV